MSVETTHCVSMWASENEAHTEALFTSTVLVLDLRNIVRLHVIHVMV